jgi:hypothetical protein
MLVFFQSGFVSFLFRNLVQAVSFSFQTRLQIVMKSLTNRFNLVSRFLFRRTRVLYFSANDPFCVYRLCLSFAFVSFYITIYVCTSESDHGYTYIQYLKCLNTETRRKRKRNDNETISKCFSNAFETFFK